MWLSACVDVGFGETPYSAICLALFDLLPVDDVLYRCWKSIDAPGTLLPRGPSLTYIGPHYSNEFAANEFATNMANVANACFTLAVDNTHSGCRRRHYFL